MARSTDCSTATRTSHSRRADPEVVAFADLGMVAIYVFEVLDMPVTVAVVALGLSVHLSGPAEWRGKIAAIPVFLE